MSWGFCFTAEEGFERRRRYTRFAVSEGLSPSRDDELLTNEVSLETRVESLPLRIYKNDGFVPSVFVRQGRKR